MTNPAYIRWLVAQKRRWHHPPDSEEQAHGFRGWHTRGYLPHFDVPGATQMTSFRLADSLPQERRHEWAEFLRIEDVREQRIRIEDYCDEGYGACELAVPEVAAKMENTLLHDDADRCGLLAWVVMPNHVHVLVQIRHTPMSKLLQSWKTITAKFVNRHFGRTGKWWQDDYHDRYIRDEAHFHKAVRYIENNPVKAGLVTEPKAWPWGSAKWRAEGVGLQPVVRPPT